MMAALGLFVFTLKTAPYQSFQHTQNWRHAFNERVGARPAWQFVGAGTDSVTLSGELYPELTGGTFSLMALKLMADSGKSWSLIDGTGMIYGMFVIESINQTKTEFMSNGTPKKISFTLNLKRADSSVVEMMGDLKDQLSDINDMNTLKNKLSGIKDSVVDTVTRALS